MRRSRAALTLFLGAMAAALQTAGLAEVQQGSSIEPAAKPQPINCYADAPRTPIVRPVAFAEDWYLDTCHPGYECYGAHGGDCYHGPVAQNAGHEPVLLDAQPIDEYEYAYEWDCEAYCEDECDAYLASPRVHLEDLSHLSADPRHSAGQDEVLRINRENEGLHAADDADCYGAWQCDEYSGECNLDEPEDLPAGETELHVARQEAPAGHEQTYSDDYGYDYGYNYAQYGEDAYAYEGYSEPTAIDAVPASQPVFTTASGVEPVDLPAGEQASVDLPAAEDLVADEYRYSDDYDYSQYDAGSEDGYAYDDYSEPYAAQAVEPAFTGARSVAPVDLPAGEQVSVDLPASEVLTDDLPVGEDLFDDLPPAESATDDLPESESGGDDVPAHEVLSTDLPVAEDIDDLPPAEAEEPANYDREAYRNDYEYDYDYNYQCDCRYNVESYGDYGAKSASHATADYSPAPAADTSSLRPVLRTASWMLNQFGEALLGLSRSVDEMADANEGLNEGTQIVPPEMDYPWPTILGRQSKRDIHPGL